MGQRHSFFCTPQFYIYIQIHIKVQIHAFCFHHLELTVILYKHELLLHVNLNFQQQKENVLQPVGV